MRCVALLFAAAAFSTGSFAAHNVSGTVWRYTFEPVVNDGQPRVHIVLSFKGNRRDVNRLELPSAWGDAVNLERGVANLTTSVRGREVRVAYDLVKAWTKPPPRADHYALIEPDYFEFNTQNGLIHPQVHHNASVEVHCDWRKLPAGWSLATSFGTGKLLQSFRGSWSEMRNALFAAGDFRISRRTIGGRPLTLAIRGRWTLTDEDISARIEKAIAIQRAFWKDNDFPYYLVTVSTFGREGGGSGGGGFTNAFALFLQPTTSFGYDVQSLLAHEVFHTWNPYRMGALPKSSIELAWFTEGFTMYYQDLLLLRTGMTGFPEYVQRLNEVLRRYSFSSAKNVSNQEVIDRHRTNSAVNEISIVRGAVAALWLDEKIRKATDGKFTLDNVMLDLTRQARRRKSALTADRIFQTISRYTDPVTRQQFRGFVESGANIEVPVDTLSPCARLQMDDIPPFELGMNREALIAERTVTEIQAGSAAFEAGLRDGQQVTGMSIYWNDASRPVKLTVRTEAGNKTIQYYPHGKPSGLTPQFHVSTTGATNDRECAGIFGGLSSFYSLSHRPTSQ